MTGPSSSQRTFRREELALVKMPTAPGTAACTNDARFDVLAEKDKIALPVRNELARVCRSCELRDCGWRQTAQVPGSAKKKKRS